MSTRSPALWVWSNGKRRRATVEAKQVWADSSTYYLVLVDMAGDTRVTHRLYRWPQPGLQVAHESRFEPSRGIPEGGGGKMPRRGPAGR